MKIVAGLGNPTKEYEGTRHNIGFSVIDKLADKYNIGMQEKKHKAICGKGMISGEKVILLKPQTYMNQTTTHHFKKIICFIYLIFTHVFFC